MSGDFSDNPTIEQVRPPGPPSAAEMSPHFPQLEILDLLGAGGMGVVYKARQKSLDRIVALKILLPQHAGGERHEAFTERFTREARALARLQHPNIVTVYDSGATENLFYFIMEYVDGLNLRQMLGAQSGRLQPHEAMAIVPGVCDALDYAHTEGIAHRDIKPENILIDRKGRVKIADFGIAKLLQRPGTNYTLTHTQQIIGTMHYMAPEQIERPSTVDHRADIYSLGVVLYEMITGELPLGRFPLPSERAMSDPWLDRVVLRALEKEPAKRYQRVSEIKTDLEHLNVAKGPVVTGTVATSAALTGTGRRRLYDRVAGESAGSSIAVPRAAVERPAIREPVAPTPVNAFTPNPSPGFDGPAWRTPAPIQPASGSGFSTPAPYTVPVPGERNTGLAYLCWCLCFFGFFGIHRLYNGRWISGCIWLVTLGLLFVGQFIDLFLVPRMVRRANEQHRPWSPTAAPSTWALSNNSPPRRSLGRIIFLLIAIPISTIVTVTMIVLIIKWIFS